MCDAIRVGLLTVNEAGKHMGGSEEAVPALYPRYKHSKVQRTCQWVHLDRNLTHSSPGRGTFRLEFDFSIDPLNEVNIRTSA